MSTQFTNRQWRLPNNENKDKQSNYSMDFDGSSHYIDIVNSSTAPTSLQSLGNSNSYSISSWINTTTTDTYSTLWFAGKTILEMRNEGTTGIHVPFNLSVSSGKLFFGRTSNYTTSDENYSSTTSVNTGSWVHCIATVDNNTLKFYINGSLDSTHTFTNATGDCSVGSNTANFFIGSRSTDGGGNDAYFNGQIDAVSIYNYALSSSQITTLYGSSSTGIGNPMAISGGGKPVAYYPLGDQDAFNGADYLVPNSSLKDYVFSFDGSNDYIDCGNDSSLNVSTSNYSLSFWIKTTSTTNLVVCEKGSNDELAIQTYTSGNIRWAGINSFETSGVNVSDGNWHHLVFVADSSSAFIYIDKNLNATGGNKIKSSSNTDSFYIGSRAGLYGFNGSISNVQVFNTALPATGSNSVETLYNNGSPLTSMSGFTSLQGWWKLDASATYDSSTTTWSIPDDSSNSNTGTSSGMTQSALQQSDLSFKTSFSPYALSFDRGSSESIDVNMDLSSFSSITVSTWAKFNSTTGYQYVYSAGTGSVAGDMLGIGKWDGTTEIYSFDRANVNRTGVSVTLNTWNHILVTHTGTTRKVYLNGSLIGTFTSGNLNLNSINFIGRYSFSASNYMDGSISNVSIWNAALTSLQVTEIYSEGIPQNLNNHSAYSNLVSWWQLGSNSSFNTNWTVLDEKGTNNGTSVNMIESDIVDGVNSYANGLSSGMGGDEVIGDAPYSTANSLSVNMDVEDRVTDTPN